MNPPSSSAGCAGERVTTMRDPYGDQTGCEYIARDWVTCAGCPPDERTFQTCPPCFVHETNAIHWPSRDHAGWASVPSISLTVRGVPPGKSMRYSLSIATNAIW